jgi:hypothetical protein
MCMVICTRTDMNTDACDQNKLMVQIFRSYINYSLWISVLFPWHVFYIVKCVSVSGVSVAVNEIFAHMDTHLSNQGYVPLQCQEFHVLLYWYQKRHGGRKLTLRYTYFAVNATLYIFISNLHLFMSI